MRNIRIYNESNNKLPTWRKGRLFGWSWLRIEWGLFVNHRLAAGANIGRAGLFASCPWLGFVFLNWNARDESDRGRWEARWSDGCLRFEHPWVRQDGWSRSDPWWKQAVRLPVVDWLLGKVRYESFESEAQDVLVPMPEGSYRATAKAVTHTHRRRWYWPVQTFETWSVDIPGGIPFAGKGENSWDCGDDGLFGLSTPADNVHEAIGSVVASVLRSRRRHGYDSAGTGRTPVRVCNPRDGGEGDDAWLQRMHGGVRSDAGMHVVPPLEEADGA